MAGPLANVDTLVAGIVNDVSRQLYYGPGVVMRFMVPDGQQINGYKTLLTIKQGFDRVPTDRVGTDAETKLVQFLIADVTGQVVKIIREKDLHIEVLDEVFTLAQVPAIGPNQAQEFTLNCRTRNIRKKGFDNSK